MTEADETAFVELAEALIASDQPFLTTLGPFILASRYLGIVSDTRSVARHFDVAHAHAIRECRHLEEDVGYLSVTDKGDRSARLFFDLTETGEKLIEGLGSP
ncbi:MAG: hypothetical protein AAGI10_12570 [Pseudomonadota bacterium]